MLCHFKYQSPHKTQICPQKPAPSKACRCRPRDRRLHLSQPRGLSDGAEGHLGAVGTAVLAGREPGPALPAHRGPRCRRRRSHSQVEWATCLRFTGEDTRAGTGTARAHGAAHAECNRPGTGRGAQAPTDQLGGTRAGGLTFLSLRISFPVELWLRMRQVRLTSPFYRWRN